jgi:hypothetical protein
LIPSTRAEPKSTITLSGIPKEIFFLDTTAICKRFKKAKPTWAHL